MKIAPDSTLMPYCQPRIAAGSYGEIWFSWSFQTYAPTDYYILGRYYMNDSLSDIDTIMPANLVMYLRGLITDKYGKVWVLGDDDVDIWTRYYEGGQWSPPMHVPGFASCNFASVAVADSAGKYWVSWSTDWYYFFSVHSSYYDGSIWSPIIPVSDRPLLDCIPTGMTTSRDGKIWITWGGVGYLFDSLYVSEYEGAQWSTGYPLARNAGTYAPSAVITASLTDNSVWISWRQRDSGSFVVVRLLSLGVPPETIWVNDQFESIPIMACDDIGRTWFFVCDSIGPFNHKLYYAIWDGDSVSTPVLVDTVAIWDRSYRAVYDVHNRRVWLTYKSNREGAVALYATYAQLLGIAEEEQAKQGTQTSFFCTPTITKCDVTLALSVPYASELSVEVYDNVGRFIDRIYFGAVTAGIHSRKIFLTEYPSGVYHLLLTMGDKVITRRVVLLR